MYVIALLPGLAFSISNLWCLKRVTRTARYSCKNILNKCIYSCTIQFDFFIKFHILRHRLPLKQHLITPSPPKKTPQNPQTNYKKTKKKKPPKTQLNKQTKIKTELAKLDVTTAKPINWDIFGIFKIDLMVFILFQNVRHHVIA